MSTDLSYWFKNALTDALKRDPVDAANDAVLLGLVLVKRAMSCLSQRVSCEIQ